jgi:hypothetical protein
LAVAAGDPLTTATVTFTNFFTPGTHTVTVNVSDGHTNASCQTTIAIEADATPPALVCPANRTGEFADETGARVTFPAPTATDDCSGSVTVTCVPAPDSLFPIGTTTVTCSAADAAGNRAQCRFAVTVLGGRSVTADVAETLARLQSRTASVMDRIHLGLAHEHLAQALRPGLWVDQSHVAPQQGGHVFDALKRTVQNLEMLRRHLHSRVNETVVRAQIARLVKVARLLAAVEFVEAADAGENAKSLAQARQELAQGDAQAAREEFASAIEHYSHAWKQAVHLGRGPKELPASP